MEQVSVNSFASSALDIFASGVTASEAMDSIELLEAIGSNASLRYATATELMHKLGHGEASNEVINAATTGDSTRLAEELRNQDPLAPQKTTFYCFQTL